LERLIEMSGSTSSSRRGARRNDKTAHTTTVGPTGSSQVLLAVVHSVEGLYMYSVLDYHCDPMHAQHNIMEIELYQQPSTAINIQNRRRFTSSYVDDFDQRKDRYRITNLTSASRSEMMGKV
jgi:hypothetical protein